MRIKPDQLRSVAIVLAILAASVTFVFAILFFILDRVADVLIVEPIQGIGEWIGQIEFEDHGGDLGITLPPSEEKRP